MNTFENDGIFGAFTKVLNVVSKCLLPDFLTTRSFCDFGKIGNFKKIAKRRNDSGEGLVHRLENLRQIALLLQYLYEKARDQPLDDKSAGALPVNEGDPSGTARPKGRALRSMNFAILLDLLKQVQPSLSLSEKDIRLLAGAEHVNASRVDLRNLQIAIDKVLRVRNLNTAIRESPELERYAERISLAFREPFPFFRLQGESLEDEGSQLAGAWRLFFVSTAGDEKPFQIRGFVAIIRNPMPSSTSSEIIVISEHAHWLGHVFLNEDHMYWTCTRPNKLESALFVMNRPDGDHIAGLGTSLSKLSKEGRRRPVESFFFFGEKWTNRPEKTPAANDLIEKAMFEESSKSVIDGLTRIFCSEGEKYQSMSELSEHYSELVEYVIKLTLNLAHEFEKQGLHLAW